MKKNARIVKISGLNPNGLPLCALLSQVLVAFTIELDNEFEREMPHRTTNHGGSRHDPWLVSMVMWQNCMRWIDKDGLRIAELAALAKTLTNLNGMQRWGYIDIEPGPAKKRIIRPTAAGERAQKIWKPLFAAIEKRWQTRFGEDLILRLRDALGQVTEELDLELPDCLPIVAYGLFSKGTDQKPRTKPFLRKHERLTLDALVARVLLAFAIEFEREAKLSLAISANVIRVLGEKGVLVADLPALSGVAMNLVSVGLNYSSSRGFVVVEADPAGGRRKVARLTPPGLKAQQYYDKRMVAIEVDWKERFGEDTIWGLRRVLEALVGEPAASPLLSCLGTYPEGWRGSLPKLNRLPHFPVVTHRGGFPDGS